MKLQPPPHVPADDDLAGGHVLYILLLRILLRTERALGDLDVGEVHVALPELLLLFPKYRKKSTVTEMICMSYDLLGFAPLLLLLQQPSSLLMI